MKDCLFDQERNEARESAIAMASCRFGLEIWHPHPFRKNQLFRLKRWMTAQQGPAFWLVFQESGLQNRVCTKHLLRLFRVVVLGLYGART